MCAASESRDGGNVDLERLLPFPSKTGLLPFALTRKTKLPSTTVTVSSVFSQLRLVIDEAASFVTKTATAPSYKHLAYAAKKRQTATLPHSPYSEKGGCCGCLATGSQTS